MKKPLFKLSIILISISVCFLSLEFFFRAYFYFRTNYDIEMWKYAVKLKQSVEDQRSHVHVPNKVAQLMNVEIKINSKGLRDREFDYQKPENVFRILAIGDSVSLGWGIPLEKSLSKQIEAGLINFIPNKKTEVLNLGIGNYNTIQELESYRREGRKYHPDAAIMFVHITDAEPIQKNTLNWFTRSSYLYAFVAQRYAQIRPWFDQSDNYLNFYQNIFQGSNWENYKKILSLVANDFKKDHLKLIIVLLPELRNLEHYTFNEYHQKVGNYFRAQNIPVIDLLPVFLGKKPGEIMVAADDPHPSQLGHDLVASEVLRQIKEKGLLP